MSVDGFTTVKLRHFPNNSSLFLTLWGTRSQWGPYTNRADTMGRRHFFLSKWRRSTPSSDKGVAITKQKYKKPYAIHRMVLKWPFTLTPTLPHPEYSSTGSTDTPHINLVAVATKSWSRVLDTKGNERDTRRLHSITLTSLSCKQIAPLRNVTCLFLASKTGTQESPEKD